MEGILRACRYNAIVSVLFGDQYGIWCRIRVDLMRVWIKSILAIRVKSQPEHDFVIVLLRYGQMQRQKPIEISSCGFAKFFGIYSLPVTVNVIASKSFQKPINGTFSASNSAYSTIRCRAHFQQGLAPSMSGSLCERQAPLYACNQIYLSP